MNLVINSLSCAWPSALRILVAHALRRALQRVRRACGTQPARSGRFTGRSTTTCILALKMPSYLAIRGLRTMDTTLSTVQSWTHSFEARCSACHSRRPKGFASLSCCELLDVCISKVASGSSRGSVSRIRHCDVHHKGMCIRSCKLGLCTGRAHAQLVKLAHLQGHTPHSWASVLSGR